MSDERATRRAMLLRRYRAYREMNLKRKKAIRARVAKRLRGTL